MKERRILRGGRCDYAIPIQTPRNKHFFKCIPNKRISVIHTGT